MKNDGDFYLSDGSGHKITDEDFTVSNDSGESVSVSWTLDNYLQASSVHYPSRARLYCVFCRKGMIIIIIIIKK